MSPLRQDPQDPQEENKEKHHGFRVVCVCVASALPLILSPLVFIVQSTTTSTSSSFSFVYCHWRWQDDGVHVKRSSDSASDSTPSTLFLLQDFFFTLFFPFFFFLPTGLIGKKTPGRRLALGCVFGGWKGQARARRRRRHFHVTQTDCCITSPFKSRTHIPFPLLTLSWAELSLTPTDQPIYQLEKMCNGHALAVVLTLSLSPLIFRKGNLVHASGATWMVGTVGDKWQMTDNYKSSRTTTEGPVGGGRAGGFSLF